MRKKTRRRIVASDAMCDVSLGEMEEEGERESVKRMGSLLHIYDSQEEEEEEEVEEEGNQLFLLPFDPEGAMGAHYFGSQA